ncbi:hypothetical protein JW921_08505 [Candidatus Fermentibacterales bacterium]|nr:hypothetical protein [Candidatus Fermentibacterales bacterium]
MVVAGSLRDIAQNRDFPGEAVFLGVYREDEQSFAIPRGDLILKAYDVVFLVTRSQFIKEASDLLVRNSRR